MDRPEKESTAQETIRLAQEADDRSQRTSDPRDLGIAVTAWRTAVEAAGPGAISAADRAEVLSQAAGALLRRYRAMRKGTSDLDLAYRWLEEAIAATPEHSPERLFYLSNAGVICQERYTAGGGPAMLDRAVSAFETAARLAAPDDQDLPQYLNNLGNALVDRFALTRYPDDLAKAVTAAGRAVDLVPSRSPDRALYLNNQANALLQRYEQTGAIADLDTAITALRTAMQRAARHPQSTEPDDLGMMLANLGSALRLRYRHRLSPRDLRAALTACQRAVSATRPGSPELAPRLAGLAEVLREQYLGDGQIDRLDSAIATYEQVLQRGVDGPEGLMG
jgi:tetratricopeptide (TPR) repeat protein